MGTNLTQTSTVGGYGITSIDEVTGKQQYSPLRTSSTWVNVAYGKKWRPALFFGYLKNLGATEEVPYGTLGTGTTLDQLLPVQLNLLIIFLTGNSGRSIHSVMPGMAMNLMRKQSNKLSFYTQSSYSAGSSVQFKKEREFYINVLMF